MEAVLYIHGKGGNADEAEQYKPLFPSCEVKGLDYKNSTPWEAGREIREAIEELTADYDRIAVVANSIGAFFLMNADVEKHIAHAYFISPIVNMEKLIADMMIWIGVSETELQEKGTVYTEFGEDLSWEYLCYVREHPVEWNVPTDILYGSRDNVTSIGTIKAFVQKHHVSLTVMDGGEHWFHTDAQMRFLGEWIRAGCGKS